MEDNVYSKAMALREELAAPGEECKGFNPKVIQERLAKVDCHALTPQEKEDTLVRVGVEILMHIVEPYLHMEELCEIVGKRCSIMIANIEDEVVQERLFDIFNEEIWPSEL